VKERKQQNRHVHNTVYGIANTKITTKNFPKNFDVFPLFKMKVASRLTMKSELALLE
jgi:hypothetical protein